MRGCGVIIRHVVLDVADVSPVLGIEDRHFDQLSVFVQADHLTKEIVDILFCGVFQKPGSLYAACFIGDQPLVDIFP